MSAPLVDIHNVTKVFGKDFKALDQISVTIPKGQIVGLVGPDGAGKTTLIRLIAALLLPTTGSIKVEGHDTALEPEEIHHLSGYMPQKFGLYEDLTVIQNLNLYAELKNLPPNEREESFKRLLDFTGLQAFTKRLAGDLSGGMKQKLGLACALITKPVLLLLDEPSVGVDPLSRRELWKMVTEQLVHGISVLWSTAYLDEAEKCDSVILINEGKLLYHGTPSGLTMRENGKVFRVTDLKTARKLLTHVVQEENVVDALIQGKDLRVVVSEEKDPPFSVAEGVITQTKPRFEDAFIDILGGGPKKPSELAAQISIQTEGFTKAIVCKGLTKKYGDFVAADRISFEVKNGEIFGLLGPNGAGKSTTFKMLCGLSKPTTGTAEVAGLSLREAASVAREQIGYMAQKFSLHSNLSVYQNLTFFSGIYNLSGREQSETIEKMMEIFHLEPYRTTNAGLLPLGFKQRLSLACATMHHPKILFLDEPTSGVDPQTRREFWNHINGLVQKGVTILVTTHFMDEAEYCDRIALIYKGKVIKIESPDGLKKIAITSENPDPTLEEAFIHLIEEYDAKH